MPSPITTPTTIEPTFEPTTLPELLTLFLSDQPSLFTTLTNLPIRYSDFAKGVPVTIVYSGRRTTITT